MTIEGKKKKKKKIGKKEGSLCEQAWQGSLQMSRRAHRPVLSFSPSSSFSLQYFRDHRKFTLSEFMSD
jgi:hypothetical protein